MVMIATLRPTPGYLLLAPDGTVLGQVERPREPDLLRSDTVLLRRELPKFN